MQNMPDVHVGREHVVWAFDPEVRAVARIHSGDTVLFTTRDCYDGQIQTAGDLRSGVDASRINPATGPLEVAGASPGQCLAIEILEIKTDPQGVMPLAAGFGVLGDLITEESTMILDLEGGEVQFPGGIRAPLEPLVGVIGVAPSAGRVPTLYPGDHGGNLDLREMRDGSTLYLPVFTPGAGLCLGDLHGRSGDGELGGTGVETGGSCLCRVTVLEGLPCGDQARPLRRPVLRRDHQLFFVASDRDISQAIRTAMRDAVEFIMDLRRLPFDVAYRAVSVLGDVRIGQVVNDLATVKLVLDMRGFGD